MRQGERIQIWRPLPDYQGCYEISNLGQVRSLDRVITRNGHPARVRGRVLSPTKGGKGYLQVHLSMDGARRFRSVHRLVLETFVGPCPEGMEACHGPGGQMDNRLVNLRWDTSGSNQLDKQRDGTDHQRNKTCCPLEHLLAAPNLRTDSLVRGHRGCLACHRARIERCRLARLGRPFDFQASADSLYQRIMKEVPATCRH